MTLRKNISGADLVTPFIDGDVPAGAVVETPDVQADGSALIWDSTYWSEDVSDDSHPSARSRRAAEKAAREQAQAQADANNAPNSDDGGDATTTEE